MAGAVETESSLSICAFKVCAARCLSFGSGLGSWLASGSASGRCLPICRGSWKVDQPEGLVNLKQRLRMSQEEIASGKQVGIKMLDDAPLRGQIEVDQNIATKDDIDPFQENHLAVITEVDPVKTNMRFEQIIDDKLVAASILEVFSRAARQ